MSTDTEVKRDSKSAWFKQGDHTVTLPSGARVGIRIPDLATLIEAGTIPQTLLDAAIGAATGSGSDSTSVENIKQEREFRDKMVELTVTDPKLTPEDVEKVPAEDKDLIVAFALRQADLDAEGEHIGGLTKSAKFRAFRGLDSLDALLEG